MKHRFCASYRPLQSFHACNHPTNLWILSFDKGEKVKASSCDSENGGPLQELLYSPGVLSFIFVWEKL